MSKETLPTKEKALKMLQQMNVVKPETHKGLIGPRPNQEGDPEIMAWINEANRLLKIVHGEAPETETPQSPLPYTQ